MRTEEGIERPLKEDPNVFTNFKFMSMSFIFTLTEIFTETSMAGYFPGRILGSDKRRKKCSRDIIILVSIMGVCIALTVFPDMLYLLGICK
jgi:hypothetical protein